MSILTFIYDEKILHTRKNEEIMKKNIILLYFLFVAAIVFCGCAKREMDFSQDSLDELQNRRVSVEELKYLTQKKYKDCIGEEGTQLIIEADIIVPSKISTGKVCERFPTLDEIEKNLCNNQQLEEIEVDDKVYEWQSFCDDGNIKMTYGYDDICALYTNGEANSETIDIEILNSNEESNVNNEKQTNISKQILTDLGYSVAEISKEFKANKEHYRSSISYAVLIEGVPVVEPDLGVDYTHVVIYDDVIAQVGFAKNYNLVKSDSTEVLPLEELIMYIKKLYNDGMIQIPGERIDQIQLMYYVDPNENLIPVWTFFSDLFDNQKENVVAFFDARTGDMLYDEVNGKVTIDE